jgi:BMFP domain-containing protein YqiC
MRAPCPEIAPDAHHFRSCVHHGRERNGTRTFFVQKKGNTMKQPSGVFNDLQARVSDLLKNSPVKDVERNVKAVLSQGFSKLDLVTREEFDTQAQVLARTRVRLEELERRVAELEQKLASSQS